MSLLVRASRNLARAKARSVAVALIVGLSLSVFLTMTIVEANIAENAQQASAAVDSTITVRPAGSFGFFSNEVMDESVLANISGTTHITSVQPVVLAREGGAPPSGGAGGQRGGGFRNFVLVEGEDPAFPLVLFGGGALQVSAGRALNASDESSMVALVGDTYASNNGLATGSTFALNGTTVQVVGIFTTGSRFGDNSLLLPYASAKAIYNVSGPTTVYAHVDEPGNVQTAEADLNATLGSNYDVVPLSQNQGQAIQNAVNAIRGSSELGSLTALATAVGVLAFVMAWAARERRAEIGLMRAIGFGRAKIVSQFLVESAALATAGFLVSLVVVMWLGPSIAGVVAGSGSATASTGTGGTGGGGGFGGGRFGGGGGGFGGAQFLVPNLIAGMDFSLQPGLILLTLGAALATAAVGAVYPLVRSVRMKPSEALRDE